MPDPSLQPNPLGNLFFPSSANPQANPQYDPTQAVNGQNTPFQPPGFWGRFWGNPATQINNQDYQQQVDQNMLIQNALKAAQSAGILGAGGYPSNNNGASGLPGAMNAAALASQGQRQASAQLGTAITQGQLPIAQIMGALQGLNNAWGNTAGITGNQNVTAGNIAQAPGVAAQAFAQQMANTTGNENISTANKAVADLVGPNAFANMSANTGGADMQQADFKNRLAQIVAANPYQSQIGHNTAANQATQTGLEGTALKDLGLNLGQGANLYMGPDGKLVGTPYGGINPQAAFSQSLLRGAMPGLPPLNVAPGYQAPTRVIPANALDQLRRTPGTKEGGNDISTPITPGGATNAAPSIAPQTNNIQSLLNSPQVIQMIQQAIQKQTGGGMTPANIAAFERNTSPNLPSWLSGSTSKQLDTQLSAYDKAHPRMKVNQ